jgi:hypothetical protein
VKNPLGQYSTIATYLQVENQILHMDPSGRDEERRKCWEIARTRILQALKMKKRVQHEEHGASSSGGGGGSADAASSFR